MPDGYGAGYTCSASAKKYTSCKSGYYLNGTGAGNSCSTCSSLGYTSSANGNSNGAAACYKSCTKACTQQACPSSAYSCNHGSTSTSGTQYYGGSCSAPSSTCSLTINSCKSGYYKNGNGCSTCSSLGYTSSANGNSNGAGACYRSCTKACTQQACPSNATCTHGSTSTSGTQYYGGSCSAASSTCSISISCKSGYYKSGSSCPSCTTVSATDLSQSCSRSPTSTELSNAHASAGTISGAKQQCTGKHTGGAGGTAGSGSCTGCSSWGTCSGGTLTITSCSPGYYLNGLSAGNRCLSCTSISASDLSQSCSRSATSTELNNAHATAGTISGATQQCTGNHTSGPTGATSASQCTGCSSWGSCSGGTLTITSCAAGYYKSGNSCKLCESGYYCNNSIRYSCPPTSSSKFYSYNGAAVLRSPAGASAATQCYLDSDVADYWTFEFQYKGFYRASGKCYYSSSTQVYNNCENNKHFSECNAGYYINKSVSMGPGFTNSCTACSPGTYTTQVGNIGSQAPGQDGSYTYATSCTACSPGTYNGATAATGCSSCKNISASDLSQSCSRGPTSTELSNAHATAGTISGATQQCTGNHTSGPTGATSSSQCTGCSSWGTCSGGTLTITSCSAGYYKDGNSCKSCPSGYPNSPDGNTGGITSCYSNTKSRAWTGGQTACTKPSGCASVSCKTCSGSACNYVAYSNSAGTGDGEIKSGCSTNGANCQQQLDKPTSASADHYISGLTCPACPESYPNSAGGNIGQSMCYKTCEDIDITGGTNVPTSSTAYYGNSCTYTTVCDDGYNLTGNTCSQLCTLGVTSLRTGNGVTIPLYSSALSTPSLNIGTGGGVCYGILESGAGTLNIQYDGKTYHAVD